MRPTPGQNAASRTEVGIAVITFDLDNTLWDVEPALIRAEQAQQDWLLRHRPGRSGSLRSRGALGIQEVRVETPP